MNLARHPALDALCGEYLLGTLRGPARRRFERALQKEPPVAARVAHWQRFTPRYSAMMEIQPSAASWKRLQKSLDLQQFRAPWYRRVNFWRNWAATASVAAIALALVIGVPQWRAQGDAANPVPIAELAGKADSARVAVHLSMDGHSLILHAQRPVIAGNAQSYELWLIPQGGAPISLAVLGSLDTKFALPANRQDGLRSGAKLAVSVEPAGGSPTGAPTGPVVLAGDIRA